ncbi:MAG TPA: response regulator [Cyanobacteria bacterium UBA11162]|nr:response regulator [Cyanobacteria bacterium UBA11162]
MTLTRLTKELDNLNKLGDGELILRNPRDTWHLYLVRGQLLYATGGFHPVRRWDRALKQHRPNWNWRVECGQLAENKPWECQLLDRGFSQKQLSPIQAKLVIRTVVQECCFELSSYTDFKSDWKPSPKAISTFCRVVALSANEMQTVITTATQIQQQWQASRLGHIRPTLTPILKPGADPQSLPISDKYLKGNFTLWDIALRLEKSVIDVTSSLNSLVEKGILEFQEIPDLPVPTAKQSSIAAPPVSEAKAKKSDSKQRLIACIDDSPVLALTLKKILMPAGYQMLSIPEPMRGFGQLIEHKPDLILLDLLLPNADGYSICKFLRETPAFKKTPIIILTAQNTHIDRVRAQLVGATEFLGKPPQPQELLQMVQKYVGE